MMRMVVPILVKIRAKFRRVLLAGDDDDDDDDRSVGSDRVGIDRMINNVN